MALLSTGLVIAGAFADKLRRTLFAQLRDLVKVGELENSEVARAAGEMNRLLYEILVNELKVDKGDVVRVRVEYKVENGRIEWDLSTLTVEAFKRIPDEDVMNVVKKVIEGGTGAPEYAAEKIGETRLGDLVYKVLENGEEKGMIVVTPVNNEAVVRGALREPPRILDKTRIPVGNNLEEALKNNLRRLVQMASPASEEQVEKTLEDIRELLE